LKGQYVVSRVSETETQRNGLFIPDQAQEKPFEGIVQSTPVVGDTQVAKGDRVLFGRYSGIELKFAGEPYLILQEDDILAVVVSE